MKPVKFFLGSWITMLQKYLPFFGFKLEIKFHSHSQGGPRKVLWSQGVALLEAMNIYEECSGGLHDFVLFLLFRYSDLQSF